jgi:hypothetical protein
MKDETRKRKKCQLMRENEQDNERKRRKKQIAHPTKNRQT